MRIAKEFVLQILLNDCFLATCFPTPALRHFSGLLVDCQFLLESAPRHLHDDPELAQHHAAGQHFVCDFLDNDARDGGRRF